MKQLDSVVIPIFNEAQSLPEVFMGLPNVESEIIYINDGSTDNSRQVLREIKKHNSKIKIINLRRNIGKATALNLGFKKAAGSVIVTMDGDLQDGPENLPVMLAKLSEGFDLVVGWKKRRFDPWGKTIPSKAFNFFVSKVARVSLHDVNSGFKVMRQEAIKELHLYGELHRFIPILIAKRGYSVTEIEVLHHPRKYGRSKYGWDRLIKGFFDFLTVMFLDTYGQKPLHFFGIIGGLSILIGLIFSIYLSILHFQGESIGQRPLLIFAVLLILAGLQLLSTGLVAEMLISKTRDDKLPIDDED